MRAQCKIKFDRPPRLKKLPEVLIISPELRNPDKQTQNRGLNKTSDRAKDWVEWTLEKPYSTSRIVC
jgi:hypothetical protein